MLEDGKPDRPGETVPFLSTQRQFVLHALPEAAFGTFRRWTEDVHYRVGVAHLIDPEILIGGVQQPGGCSDGKDSDLVFELPAAKISLCEFREDPLFNRGTIQNDDKPIHC